MDKNPEIILDDNLEYIQSEFKKNIPNLILSSNSLHKIEFLNIDSKQIICKRKYVLNKGFYENDKYEAFRKFKETVAKNDNSKIILTKL